VLGNGHQGEWTSHDLHKRSVARNQLDGSVSFWSGALKDSYKSLNALLAVVRDPMSQFGRKATPEGVYQMQSF